MRILFIAPLPPPINGQSNASNMALEAFASEHECQIIDLSKENMVEGIDSLKRVFQIISIFWQVFAKRRARECIYFTISESIAGNLKDLIIYLLCYRDLGKMYIHLHGGSIKRNVWEKYRILCYLNRQFISKMAGVIVSGESHKSIFQGMIDQNRIHLLSNFASDDLFVSTEQIRSKYTHFEKIKVLYISGMKRKKGYEQLAEAFSSLNASERQAMQVDFAGRFDSERNQAEFVEKYEKYSDIHYHGMVSNEKKRLLFQNSHVFCLPTSYLEGQPISILEAYASGCIVIATGPAGVLDIFKDGRNGYLIEDRSSDSIKTILQKLIKNKLDLKDISISNLNDASGRYTSEMYKENLLAIIEAIKN